MCVFSQIFSVPQDACAEFCVVSAALSSAACYGWRGQGGPADGLGGEVGLSSDSLDLLQAFSIDIIRHKDSMDELFSQRNEIFGTCGEEQKAVLQVSLPLPFTTTGGGDGGERGEGSAPAQAEVV